MSDSDMSNSGHDPRALIGSNGDARIPCGLVEDLLPAAIGGDLEPETEEVLSRHLSECVRCRREWNGYADAEAALQTLRQEEAGIGEAEFDDGFYEDLHSSIVGEIQRRSQLSSDVEHLRQRSRRAKASRWSWLPMAATLAATLLAGFFVREAFDRPEPEARVVPQVRSVGDSRSPVDRPLHQLMASREFLPYLQEALRKYVDEHRGSAEAEPIPLARSSERVKSETDY